MPGTPLDMLVVRDLPDGTFAVADALQGVRIVQDGFRGRAEAEKFIEDYYLAGGVIARSTCKSGRGRAEMSIAAGLGPNVLVGGSTHTSALQPLSVQGHGAGQIVRRLVVPEHCTRVL
jgi:hypothetical protein